MLSLSFEDRHVRRFVAARMHASTPMTGARSSVDRVLASEARGRWFDPSRARHHLVEHFSGVMTGTKPLVREAPHSLAMFCRIAHSLQGLGNKTLATLVVERLR